MNLLIDIIILIVCLLSFLLCVVDASNPNATYNPLKGTYLISFQDSSGRHNCSIYVVSTTMLLVDNCGSSNPYIKGLNFSFNGEPVPRVVYTYFGVLLEVERTSFDHYDALLNITSETDPESSISINFHEETDKYRFFSTPTQRGLSALTNNYVETAKNNILMNSKMIILFYLTFDDFDCDAYFWVGKGDKPDKDGMKIPDENGSMEPLGEYYKKTIVLTLPKMDIKNPISSEMTVYDIDYLGIYCPEKDKVYGSPITFEEINRSPITKIHPPFFFDKFFLGEDLVLLCMPNGAYSRELNLDDSMTILPCMGGNKETSYSCAVSSFNIPSVLLFLLHSKSFFI